LQELRCNEAVIDGELVALAEAGRPSFQLLQNYSNRRGTPAAFIGFDLLVANGHSLMSLPLSERQGLLARVVKGAGLQLSEPLDADLATVLRVISEQQLEGVVAKDRNSPYQPGVRGGSWFKQRIGLSQDFVVGGYTRGDPYDALVVGYYSGRKLTYAGKVRAGFIPATRRTVAALVQPHKIAECPFVELPITKRGRWGEGLTAEDVAKCVWVKPRLVVTISFVEWTERGSLRHAKFVRVNDKARPTNVRRITT
jgi:bifunctional non-homologous end joining protein LigD